MAFRTLGAVGEPDIGPADYPTYLVERGGVVELLPAFLENKRGKLTSYFAQADVEGERILRLRGLSGAAVGIFLTQQTNVETGAEWLDRQLAAGMTVLAVLPAADPAIPELVAVREAADVRELAQPNSAYAVLARPSDPWPGVAMLGAGAVLAGILWWLSTRDRPASYARMAA